MAIDTIINQKHEPIETRPICVYVAIGQKESKTARSWPSLPSRARWITPSSSRRLRPPAAFQYLAPFAGAAIGEDFMEPKDALVVYDDLSKQAVATARCRSCARRPVARRTRAMCLLSLPASRARREASPEKGGGSITALPIIETQEGDVSAYIPTNVISITDGQIFLEADLFNKGTRPAINVGISVRASVQPPDQGDEEGLGQIKLELAQFRELEAFHAVRLRPRQSDEAPSSRATGQRTLQILKQGQYMPMPMEKQVAIIYWVVNGMLDEVPVEEIPDYEKQFMRSWTTSTAACCTAFAKKVSWTRRSKAD